MDLKTILKALAEHYAWNDRIHQLRELAAALREIAEEADGMANECEERAA